MSRPSRWKASTVEKSHSNSLLISVRNIYISPRHYHMLKQSILSSICLLLLSMPVASLCYYLCCSSGAGWGRGAVRQDYREDEIQRGGGQAPLLPDCLSYPVPASQGSNLQTSVGGSVTFWCGSGSDTPDPYLWQMDPDPIPDPTPDPTPYFIDFKDAKNL